MRGPSQAAAWLSSALVACLAFQAAALPALYAERRSGCLIPEQGFAGHQDPMQSDAVTFTITDAAGAAATAFTPGGSYTITVEDTAATMTTHAWIHVTAGEIVESTVEREDCPKLAWFTPTPERAATHTVTWAAPTCGVPNVAVSTAIATGASAAYMTNSVTLQPTEALPACDEEDTVTNEEDMATGAVGGVVTEDMMTDGDGVDTVDGEEMTDGDGVDTADNEEVTDGDGVDTMDGVETDGDGVDTVDGVETDGDGVDTMGDVDTDGDGVDTVDGGQTMNGAPAAGASTAGDQAMNPGVGEEDGDDVGGVDTTVAGMTLAAMTLVAALL